MSRYARLMPSLEANESVGVLNPARFDGLRGLFAARVKPVIGLEVIQCETAAGGPETPTLCRDAISKRAYEIYLKRAGRPGTPESDWSQAVRELEDEVKSRDADARRVRAITMLFP
ncbi:MAG: DUF2934 domain-containing protein [Phycisphaerales bacterium]